VRGSKRDQPRKKKCKKKVVLHDLENKGNPEGNAQLRERGKLQKEGWGEARATTTKRGQKEERIKITSLGGGCNDWGGIGKKRRKQVVVRLP